MNVGKGDLIRCLVKVPFLRAFCLSALRWAAAGLRARSLSLAIVRDDVLDGCS